MVLISPYPVLGEVFYLKSTWKKRFPIGKTKEN